MGSLLPARWAASLAPLLRTPGARGAALVGLAACLSRCSLSDFDSLSSGLNLNGNLPDGGAGASFEPDASTDTNTGGTGGGPGPGAAAAGIAKAPGYILFLALAVIAVVVVAGLAFGTNARLG